MSFIYLLSYEQHLSKQTRVRLTDTFRDVLHDRKMTSDLGISCG